MKAYYNSPIGIIEIVSSSTYITSIKFVKEKKQDIAYSPDEILKECIKQLDEYFSGSRKEFTIPFLQNGTEFQKLVWKELQTIPFGKTTTYGELAKQINKSLAARAIGFANGKNNIAIIIPCHRVIGVNKKLVGYNGEIWRKQWLINREKKVKRISCSDISLQANCYN